MKKLIIRVIARLVAMAKRTPFAFTGVIAYWILQIYVMSVVYSLVGPMWFFGGLIVTNIVSATVLNRRSAYYYMTRK